MKRQVQFAKEEKIQEIYHHFVEFLKIDTYEEKGLNKYKEMNGSKKKQMKLIKKISEWISSKTKGVFKAVKNRWQSDKE